MEYEIEWTRAVLPASTPPPLPTSVVRVGGTVIIRPAAAGNGAEVEFTDMSVTPAVQAVFSVAGTPGSYYGDSGVKYKQLYKFFAYENTEEKVISGMIFRTERSAEDSGGHWGGPQR